MDDVTSAILLGADRSSDALRRLYGEAKRRDQRCSLRALCGAAGITSTGYLSDVLHGRRVLHAKYRLGIVRAFRLRGAAATCLKTMIALDNEANPARRPPLTRRLEQTRKALRFRHRPLTGELHGLFVAFEVFCAFGLYANRPRPLDLERYFGPARAAEVTTALATLLGLGLITAAGDHLALVDDQVMFGGGPGTLTHVEFLRLALTDAAANVERWFPRPRDSHFVSSVISVAGPDYRRKLQRLKEQLLVAQGDLESSAADGLIRFNVQIYPLSGEPAAAPR